MKKILLLATALISFPSFAVQEGSYACSVDAFTQSTVVVKSIELNNETKLPLIEYSYYRRGVQYQIQGIATVHITASQRMDHATRKMVETVSESYRLSGVDHEVISFEKDGEVSSECKKVK